jgi:hypothetical protein
MPRFVTGVAVRIAGRSAAQAAKTWMSSRDIGRVVAVAGLPGRCGLTGWPFRKSRPDKRQTFEASRRVKASTEVGSWHGLYVVESLGQLSPDGSQYWDGQQWKPTLSPDAQWRWDGVGWKRESHKFWWLGFETKEQQRVRFVMEEQARARLAESAASNTTPHTETGNLTARPALTGALTPSQAFRNISPETQALRPAVLSRPSGGPNWKALGRIAALGAVLGVILKSFNLIGEGNGVDAWLGAAVGGAVGLPIVTVLSVLIRDWAERGDRPS